MDIKKMQLMLMEKGIRVAADDPIFTMLAMNQIVLEEIIKRQQPAPALKNDYGHPVRISCQAHNQSPIINRLKIISGASLAFAAGMFLGSKDMGALLSGSVGLGLGALVGIMLSYLSVLRIEKQHPSALVDVLDTLVWIEGKIGTGIGASTNWTDTDLQRASHKTKLSSRTLAACRDVLVCGLAASEAAEKNNVLPPQIFRGLSALRRAVKQ